MSFLSPVFLQIALLASLGFSLLEVGNWSLRGGVERVSVVGHVLVGDQEAGGTLCTKAIDRYAAANAGFKVGGGGGGIRRVSNSHVTLLKRCVQCWPMLPYVGPKNLQTTTPLC